nr:hypothetical protein GCM10025699_17960 [Microbacterium flavescens]
MARRPRFFDLPLQPEMTVVVGRNAATVEASARKWGWAETATDWREVIARDDIDVVDIVTPGNTHAEIAIAALEAGKHVLCEKPSPTPSPKPSRWREPRRAPPSGASARWWASPTGACRRRRSRAISSPRGASAKSARCAPSTCRTG